MSRSELPVVDYEPTVMPMRIASLVSDTRKEVRALCTIETAKDILEFHNTRNRDIRWSKVAAYAGAMQRHSFADVGQIIFHKSGVLLDGQHRLLAMVECELPQIFTFSLGHDWAVQGSVDRQQRRSLFDAVRLGKDEPRTDITPVAVAITKHVWPGSRMDDASRFTHIYDKYREPILFAADLMDIAPCKVRGIKTSLVFSSSVWPWHYADNKDDLAEFALMLLTGQGRSNKDPIMYVRDWLIGETARRRPRRHDVIRRMHTAIDYHLRGVIHVKQFRVQEGLFPPVDPVVDPLS